MTRRGWPILAISKLEIENFQGFASFQEIEIRPITLIFGPNSSGKSSIFRAISLLRQSVGRSQLSNRGGVNFPVEILFTGANRRDLGSFQTVVNCHDVGKKIRLGVEITGRPSWIGYTDFQDTKSAGEGSRFSDPSRQEVKAKFTMTFTSPGLLTGLHVEIFDHDEILLGDLLLDVATYENNLDSAEPIRMFSLVRASDGFSKLVCDYLLFQEEGQGQAQFFRNSLAKSAPISTDQIRSLLQAMSNAEIGDITTFNLQPTDWELIQSTEMSEKKLAVVLRNLLFDLGMTFKGSLSGIAFVDALRDIPKRFSPINGATNQILNRDGANMLSWLSEKENRLSSTSDLLSRATNGRYSVELKELNIDEFDYLRYGALQLVEKSTGTRVSFEDVGVGLSQLLPIIAHLVWMDETHFLASDQSFLRPRLLGIEQPELHLHPRMQADLMDILIDSVQEGETSGKTVLLETHSETMLMRLQRRIREQKISRDDVSIIYVEVSAVGSVVKRLTIDEDGSFVDRWPAAFSSLRREDSI